jgi:hypothetical protein
MSSFNVGFCFQAEAAQVRDALCFSLTLRRIFAFWPTPTL